MNIVSNSPIIESQAVALYYVWISNKFGFSKQSHCLETTSDVLSTIFLIDVQVVSSPTGQNGRWTASIGYLWTDRTIDRGWPFSIGFASLEENLRVALLALIMFVVNCIARFFVQYLVSFNDVNRFRTYISWVMDILFYIPVAD